MPNTGGRLIGTLWSASTAGFGGYFEEFIAHKGEPALWQAIMLVLTGGIVVGGVRAGIERANLFLMPLLAFIVLSLAVFSLSLSGSSKGVSFLLAPAGFP